MDPEPMPAAIAAGDEIIKTAQNKKSGRHKPQEKRASGKRTDKPKTSTSGKHNPGTKRKSGKHKPNTRGTFKQFVALRAAATHCGIQKQIEEQDAELTRLRNVSARFGTEIDAANKLRFKAVSALEDVIGRAASAFVLSK